MRRVLYEMVPPLAMFGPLFIALSLSDAPLWKVVFALVGALMTGAAILAVLLRQRKIEARLDAHVRLAAEVGGAER